MGRAARVPKILVFIVGIVVTGNASAEGLMVHGALTNRYRYRTDGDVSDQDLETLFSTEIGDPMLDRTTGSLQIGGVFQLDGRDTSSPFASVYDTYSSSAVERIYHAYVNSTFDKGPIQSFRLGRQFRQEFESLYFDGGLFETKTSEGLTFTGYGGIPVHMYENSTGLDWGDWMAGGALQWDPFPVFRLRLEAVHITDDAVAFRANFGDQQDTLMGVDLFWDATPNVSLSSEFAAFSDQVKDLALSARVRAPKSDLAFSFRYYNLLNPIGVRVIDFDAFSFAGVYEPFQEILATATKGFGQHFSADLGLSMRMLNDFQIASAFNHGYQRAFLTFNTMSFPLSGMSLSTTVDYYHGNDNALEDNTMAASFAIDQELLKRKLRLSGGTMYYLYKYNFFTGDEDVDVQTYYARITTKWIKQLETRLGYEFETSSLDTYHTFDGRVTWRF